jgi:hypothetical protein
MREMKGGLFFLCSLSLGFEDELRWKRDELRAISGGRGRRKGKG